ncbi:MAG: O-antigen ligase family protein [Nitrospiraceae bacterium]|nr:O-antigen ligase family protein [Nitrospiraceae bacterium]
MSFKKNLLEKIKLAEWLLLLLSVFSLPLFRSPTEIFLYSSALFFVVRHIYEKDIGMVLFAKDVRLGFLAIFASACLSALFALKPGLALLGSMGYLKMYTIFIIIASDFSDRNSIKIILRVVIAASVIAGAYGLMRYEMGLNDFVEFPSGGMTNHTAIYLGLALLIAFYYFFNVAKEAKLFEKTMAACGGIAILILLMFSSSRSWLSYGRMLFIPFVLFYFDRKKILKIAALVLIICALFAMAFPPNMQFASYGGRAIAWELSWEVYKAHPILGIGAKHLRFNTAEMYNLTHESHFNHAHNLFLNVLCHQGTVGFLSLMFLLYLIYKLLRKTNEDIKPLIVSVCISYFLISFVNTTLHSQHGFLFSVIIGMANNRFKE